jgi:hypothetical protein
MTLTQLKVNDSSELLLYALSNSPSLLIDCANCADPHKYSRMFKKETFEQVFVIEIELLYKFRDVLRSLPKIVNRLKINTIVITKSNHLFNYSNDEENKAILEHCNELIQKLSEMYDIIIGE